jgi:hypothetical protein
MYTGQMYSITIHTQYIYCTFGKPLAVNTTCSHPCQTRRTHTVRVARREGCCPYIHDIMHGQRAQLLFLVVIVGGARFVLTAHELHDFTTNNGTKTTLVQGRIPFKSRRSRLERFRGKSGTSRDDLCNQRVNPKWIYLGTVLLYRPIWRFPVLQYPIVQVGYGTGT